MSATGSFDTALAVRLKAALAPDPPIRLAVLFGSVAAGRERAESDIDIAILVRENGHDATDEASLLRVLTRAAGRNVDLVRIDRASTLLLWQIATKGIALFEAEPGAFHRFQARAASEYLDFAPALHHYGEVFRRRLAGSETER